MKLLIASDIHGAAPAVQRLLDFAAEWQPDRLVLLGDLLYHGPRNPLPAGYDPAAVFAALNAAAGVGLPITAVRGNCDAEVDQMVLDFPIMADATSLDVDGRRFTCTHGHLEEVLAAAAEVAAAGQVQVLLTGHTHVKELRRGAAAGAGASDAAGAPGTSNAAHDAFAIPGLVHLNPGSLGLPKDDCASFATYDNGLLELRALETGAVISSLAL